MKIYFFYWVFIILHAKHIKVNQADYSTMKTYAMGIVKGVYTILSGPINYPDVFLKVFELPKLADFSTVNFSFHMVFSGSNSQLILKLRRKA